MWWALICDSVKGTTPWKLLPKEIIQYIDDCMYYNPERRRRHRLLPTSALKRVKRPKVERSEVWEWLCICSSSVDATLWSRLPIKLKASVGVEVKYDGWLTMTQVQRLKALYELPNAYGIREFD